jgi:hypothetical protein
MDIFRKCMYLVYINTEGKSFLSCRKAEKTESKRERMIKYFCLGKWNEAGRLSCPSEMGFNIHYVSISIHTHSFPHVKIFQQRSYWKHKKSSTAHGDEENFCKILLAFPHVRTNVYFMYIYIYIGSISSSNTYIFYLYVK